jgi:hypothetical protein
MKTSSKYANMATVLAGFGAVALVGVYYPIINRAQFRIDFHRHNMPLGWCLLGTPVSLAILAASWHLNRKAGRIKREEEKGPPSGPAR